MYESSCKDFIRWSKTADAAHRVSALDKQQMCNAMAPVHECMGKAQARIPSSTSKDAFNPALVTHSQADAVSGLGTLCQ